MQSLINVIMIQIARSQTDHDDASHTVQKNYIVNDFENPLKNTSEQLIFVNVFFISIRIALS